VSALAEPLLSAEPAETLTPEETAVLSPLADAVVGDSNTSLSVLPPHAIAVHISNTARFR